MSKCKFPFSDKGRVYRVRKQLEKYENPVRYDKMWVCRRI